jgi:uncharacterized membrane protein YdbT with pleckstrin-like domain
MIGKLETPFVWNENVVCRSCHEQLASSSSPAKRSGVAQEDSIFRTTLHPFRVFVGPICGCFLLLVMTAIIVISLEKAGNAGITISAILCLGLIFSVLPLVSAYIRFRFSSFIITSRRISIKRGWLSRNTFEMLLPKIESIHVEQGILDRMFGTGVVVINGTGGSHELFPGIRHAIEFRRMATESIERYAQVARPESPRN